MSNPWDADEVVAPPQQPSAPAGVNEIDPSALTPEQQRTFAATQSDPDAKPGTSASTPVYDYPGRQAKPTEYHVTPEGQLSVPAGKPGSTINIPAQPWDADDVVQHAPGAAPAPGSDGAIRLSPEYQRLHASDAALEAAEDAHSLKLPVIGNVGRFTSAIMPLPIGDEISGAVDAGKALLADGFGGHIDPRTAYLAGKDANQEASDAYRSAHPVSATMAGLLGAVLGIEGVGAALDTAEAARAAAAAGKPVANQNVCSMYEQWLIQVAIYIWKNTANGYYLTYAENMWNTFKAHLKCPSGVYWSSLVINPAGCTSGAPSGATYTDPVLSPYGAQYFGQLRLGWANQSFGGTVQAAVNAVDLYAVTGVASYEAEALSIVQGMMVPFNAGGGVNGQGGFLSEGGYVSQDVTPPGLFLPWTDPFTDAQGVMDFARRVLPLVDPGDSLQCGQAIQNTAASVAALRANNGYPADWGGVLAAPPNIGLIGSSTSYAGCGYAQRTMMQVTANAIAMIQAGEEIANWGRMTG